MSLMGNKRKLDQSTHKQMNDYEKIRLLRVQENKERLLHLGVKSIAKSLSSLVECQNTKKKKVKPTNTNVRYVDYIPHIGEDSEGDYQEIDTSAKVSKKQHRPQFIAPLSMNKVDNLAKKHRMIAPKVCDKFPLGSSATKENRSRETITMCELILNNEGTQRQREEFKQNAAKPTCITREAKRRLNFVDEDEDSVEDDETLFN